MSKAAEWVARVMGGLWFGQQLAGDLGQVQAFGQLAGAVARHPAGRDCLSVGRDDGMGNPRRTTHMAQGALHPEA